MKDTEKYREIQRIHRNRLPRHDAVLNNSIQYLINPISYLSCLSLTVWSAYSSRHLPHLSLLLLISFRCCTSGMVARHSSIHVTFFSFALIHKPMSAFLFCQAYSFFILELHPRPQHQCSYRTFIFFLTILIYVL